MTAQPTTQTQQTAPSQAHSAQTQQMGSATPTPRQQQAQQTGTTQQQAGQTTTRFSDWASI